MRDLPERELLVEWLRASAHADDADTVSELHPVDTGFFQRACVFSVRGRRGLLPFPALPTGSFGIFAYDGRTFSSLVPEDNSLDRLLQHEGRDLTEADPTRFAELVCDVRLRDPGNRSHAVVASPDALRGIDAQSPFRNYTVREKELRRVEHRLPPPTIVKIPAGGWAIGFATVYGWMHDKKQLGVERIDISSDYRVHRHEREVLSKRIFAKTPGLRY